MRVIKALARQSLFDVAVEQYKKASMAWTIARVNDMEITFTFEKDTIIIIDDDLKIKESWLATGILDAINSLWILAQRAWQDAGKWIDTENWKD
jgi:hypothetical protein